MIAGDLFPVKSNLDLFCKGDAKALFGDAICDLFATADYRICNLEGALTDGLQRGKKTGPVVTAPIEAVTAYKTLGIDCCMLANNHITDGCTQGVADTLKTLSDAGIQHIGTGMNETSIRHYLTITLDGEKVCFYNVSETMYNIPTSREAGAWLYDEYIVCKELEILKKKCDYIIVIYHGGIEHFPYPSPEMKKRFHRMADSGADIILSQHTHCVGCEECYNGAYLLYGQGDFLFNNCRPKTTDMGIILEVDIKEGHWSVKKHLVRCTDDFHLEYNKDYDFADFYMRSEKVKDDEFLLQQFQQFCDGELPLYLTAFKSPGKMLRKYKWHFPNRFNNWLLKKAYTRKDLLFSLHTLRSEQNRETAIMGIKNMLERGFGEKKDK